MADPVVAACEALSRGEFSVERLEIVCSAVHSPSTAFSIQQTANKTLMQLMTVPELWNHSDAIIEQAPSMNTKFFGLQVLEDAIKTRWKILPDDQKAGIKNYIVGKVISMSSDENTLRTQKVLLQKLNMTLVEILKQEWPQNWESFIPDLVGSSKTSEILCENNMQILKLLSEEVFDFSVDQMVTEKVKQLKLSLNEQFHQIFQLCEYVLEHSQRPSLLIVTLQTLQRFLTWIPLGFIFQTNVIDVLINKFFPVQMFRNAALDCLSEIGSLKDLEPQYDVLFQKLFAAFLNRLGDIFSPETDLQPAYLNSSEPDRLFIQKLAMFLSGFFKAHLNVLELPESQQYLIPGMWYLVRVSEVKETEIFRICLEAWYMLAEELYKSESASNNGAGILNLNHSHHHHHHNGRRMLYASVLNGVRQVMIANMAKPEEVLIVEDENGDIVRETAKDTDVIAQYKTMRDTLVYLTHLSPDDTERIMLDKLTEQVKDPEWEWHNLNTLCWAIGSISGAMAEDEEKRFLVTVIKDLLGLCEQVRGKDNKAVVASNIMYVVGQYPRFLKAHWKFLVTVVNKLFEFMHESHPGVQDMACDTFLKIVNKCKRNFVVLQAGEKPGEKAPPFVCHLVDSLPKIISDLEPHQVQSFYEAAATMLSDRGPSIAIDRKVMLGRLMELPNRTWKMIMESAGKNVEYLVEPSTIKEIIKILKTNNRVCGAVGSLFTHQLETFFLDMLNVYKVYSERISAAVAAQGEHAVQMSLIRTMRSAKKEVLRLLIVFIDKSGPPEAEPLAVAQGFIPPVLDPILGDYRRNIAGARDPEVLTLFATVIEKLRSNVAADVPRIMEAVFEVTLEMITKNFEDFPEHRIRFFEFLKAINQHCFPSLFNIPPEHQRLVVHAVVWAMKHQERNIADTGLEILHELLSNVGRSPSVAQAFYQQYLLSLIQDVFAVLTDRLHKSGFKMHATLLLQMFHLVQTNQVTVPLFDPSTQPPGTSNPSFLREHISKLLTESFANLTRSQVTQFVDGMFDVTMALPAFKTHLRDFLITLKEFSVEDNSGLYAEEAERAALERQQALMAQRQAIPGMVAPGEIDNDL